MVHRWRPKEYVVARSGSGVYRRDEHRKIAIADEPHIGPGDPDVAGVRLHVEGQLVAILHDRLGEPDGRQLAALQVRRTRDDERHLLQADHYPPIERVDRLDALIVERRATPVPIERLQVRWLSSMVAHGW